MAAEGTELQTTEAQPIERAEETASRAVFTPRADVRENGDAITVVADMPGVQEGGLDITLEKNVLTIQGSVGSGVPEGYRPIYSEYEDGDYERSFVLPEKVDRDKIEATLNNGVLGLRLPKLREAAARKIPIKVG
jgi:HSP20 family molecular chaperone IbpA